MLKWYGLEELAGGEAGGASAPVKVNAQAGDAADVDTIEQLRVWAVAALREQAQTIAEARDTLRATEAAFDREWAFVQLFFSNHAIIRLNVNGVDHIDVSERALYGYKDNMIEDFWNAMDDDGRCFVVRPRPYSVKISIGLTDRRSVWAGATSLRIQKAGGYTEAPQDLRPRRRCQSPAVERPSHDL